MNNIIIYNVELFPMSFNTVIKFKDTFCAFVYLAIVSPCFLDTHVLIESILSKLID